MHTPGPWRVDFARTPDGIVGFRVLAPERWHSVANCNCYEPCNAVCFTPEEKYSNAHLIAAAPDLLEALKHLIEDPDYQVAIGGNPYAVEAMLSRCRAAIAKAEGR